MDSEALFGPSHPNSKTVIFIYNNCKAGKNENKQSILAFAESKINRKNGKKWPQFGQILQKNTNKQRNSDLKKTILTVKIGVKGVIIGGGGLV